MRVCVRVQAILHHKWDKCVSIPYILVSDEAGGVWIFLQPEKAAATVENSCYIISNLEKQKLVNQYILSSTSATSILPTKKVFKKTLLCIKCEKVIDIIHGEITYECGNCNTLFLDEGDDDIKRNYVYEVEHLNTRTGLSTKSSLSHTAIPVVEEDKRCFACVSIDSECIVPCHWTQRCYLKSKHANDTLTDRRCTDERWVRDLLVDGCLTYNGNYWCMCSTDMCNSGDFESIRGFDDCSNSPCTEGTICLDTKDGFNCICPPWQDDCTYWLNCETMTGQVPEELIPLLLKEAADDSNDEDSKSKSCLGDPCGLDGICIPMPEDKYVCLCQNRIIAAKSCEESHINPCEPNNPCRNGRCVPHVRGGFRCKCNAGWHGRRCDQGNSYCAKYNPCINNGTCYDDKDTYKCHCIDNFHGRRCEKATRRCSVPQCFNGGVCVNTVDNFKCICPIDYEGQRCDMNIDDCRIDSCTNNGTCIDLVHDFRCQCTTGFTGNVCQYDLRECNDTLCLNLGTCYIGFEGFAQCNCNQVFTGLFCETRIHPCFPNPCTHGGTCVSRGNKVACLCRPKFTGNQCEITLD
ncbi:unnamed protein product [Didymodactylos carnosus]|uniref:EGF-like domain-containing protein n=1 Tax=Didymodactylos carnosus TaxID=1234261 RepID=A0A813Y435_9BILA|nr:unnamed protein product [Didymodactylos carnosus]CAF3664660.1 unnamed protein product [Didymodactylos carnosus]